MGRTDELEQNLLDTNDEYEEEEQLDDFVQLWQANRRRLVSITDCKLERIDQTNPVRVSCITSYFGRSIMQSIDIREYDDP